MGIFFYPWLRVICDICTSQNPASTTSCRQLEMTHLIIQAGHLTIAVDSWGFLPLRSVPAPLLLYGNNFFIQPSISCLSDCLCYSHIHFLTFTVSQQIHPSYQEIRLKKEVVLEMHVPASPDFITELKVFHRLTLVQPPVCYWPGITTPCSKPVITLQ